MITKLQLHWQIIICMILGTILGTYYNQIDFINNQSYTLIVLLGDIFVRLLKMVIVPLIFTSIIIGISSIKDQSKIGRLGLKTFIYYMCTSLFAILIGLTLANVIQPGVGAVTIDQVGAYDTSKLSTSNSILDILKRMIPTNPIGALAKGDILGVIFFALFFGVKNGMGEGDFFSLIIALYMIYTPLKKISAIQNKLKVLEAPLARVESLLNMETTIRSPQCPKPINKPFKEEITFENVNFEYESGKATLQNINTTIPFAETVGLVGESGAGKSTFANLLLRLYEPNEGCILFGGIDIKEFDIKELRELISYVPQSPILFNNSILENIRIGNPNASDEAIIEAAKLANAHEFILEMENGYQTMISERGSSLSGGQRQRISISRAFLKDSPILILDEATSSLDNKADKEIKETLKNLCKGRTSLIIAHRLSSLEDINQRMVFQNGKIVGYGEHKELMNTCAHYKEIIDMPSRLA